MKGSGHLSWMKEDADVEEERRRGRKDDVMLGSPIDPKRSQEGKEEGFRHLPTFHLGYIHPWFRTRKERGRFGVSPWTPLALVRVKSFVYLINQPSGSWDDGKRWVPKE